MSEKQMRSWARPIPPKNQEPKSAVPSRPFIAGDMFRTRGAVLHVIGRMSGRGRNRAARVASFDEGVRLVAWRRIHELRYFLEINSAKPFVGKFCRVCGCIDVNCRACVKLTGKPCYWVDDEEPPLCSACQLQRLPDAQEDGVVTHVGGGAANANPFHWVDDFPNDLYEHWRKGWMDDKRTTEKDAAIAQGNARALASLGAVIGAAKKAGLA